MVQEKELSKRDSSSRTIVFFKTTVASQIQLAVYLTLLLSTMHKLQH